VRRRQEVILGVAKEEGRDAQVHASVSRRVLAVHREA
jgi:hypothetical protein